ncbi:MAG: M16 family metallopeptidase [Nitrospirota bacterium]
MKIKLLFLLILLTVAGCASSGTIVGRAAPDISRKEVRTYRFPNGVNLIIKKTRKNAPTSIQVWLPGGSSADPPGKPGVAHFVEHMIFSGSLHIPPGKAELYVEKMGGRLSGHTARDFNYFTATVPGGQPVNGGWQRAEDILFDMVAHPTFDKAQVEEQRRVILLEIAEREREPETALSEGLFAAAYKVDPYKNRITGSADNVKSLTRKDLLDFYKATYVPSNMTVVVAGGADTQEVKARIEKTFGTLAPAKYKRPAYGREKYQVAERSSELSMPVKLAYAELGWHICSANNPDIYALEVLGVILGGGKGSRLYMELRERRGIAYGIEMEMFPLREPGILAVRARMDPLNISQFSNVVLGEVDRIKDRGVPQAELDSAIRAIIASDMINNGTAEGQAYALGYWATVYGGTDPRQYIQGIKSVTADEVRRVAQKYLGEGNYTLSTIMPK